VSRSTLLSAPLEQIVAQAKSASTATVKLLPRKVVSSTLNVTAECVSMELASQAVLQAQIAAAQKTAEPVCVSQLNAVAPQTAVVEKSVSTPRAKTPVTRRLALAAPLVTNATLLDTASLTPTWHAAPTLSVVATKSAPLVIV